MKVAVNFLKALLLVGLSTAEEGWDEARQSYVEVSEHAPSSGNPGERLLLTPLIQQGQIEEARRLAEVANLTDDPKIQRVKSFSGYLTVNEKYNSNLFFWFFPAMFNPSTSPVLLWLQGGPGYSSLVGLLIENGPFIVNVGDETLSLNPYSWTLNHSLIYVDQPVGTGFSFTDSVDGYATNQTQVGDELYSALIQFFTMFPEYQTNEFYVTGQSYAGKYIPAIGHTIYKRNPDAQLKINLQGLAIGNGLTDPESMVSEYSFLMYEYGLIDEAGLEEIRQYEQQCVQSIRNGEMLDAFQYWTLIIEKCLNDSGYTSTYNIMHIDEPWHNDSLPKFLQKEETRRALHVGDAEFTSKGIVYHMLKKDIMKSVRPWVEELLNAGLRIMFYNGNLDIIVGYPLSRAMFKKLEFVGAEEYKTAKRQLWMVGSDISGYVKSGGSFSEVMVRNAGHLVPTDQPAWALDLIKRFSRNQSLVG